MQSMGYQKKEKRKSQIKSPHDLEQINEKSNLYTKIKPKSDTILIFSKIYIYTYLISDPIHLGYKKPI